MASNTFRRIALAQGLLGDKEQAAEKATEGAEWPDADPPREPATERTARD